MIMSDKVYTIKGYDMSGDPAVYTRDGSGWGDGWSVALYLEWLPKGYLGDVVSIDTITSPDGTVYRIDNAAMTARNVSSAHDQASAYVWGRQDGGESERDTGYSLDFAHAFATRRLRYDTHLAGNMPNLEHAFTQWRDTGTIPDSL